MNLKKLNSYNEFKYNEFLQGKKLVLNAIKFDDKTSTIKGELVITEDPTKENLYGKINFKIEEKLINDVNKYEVGNSYKISGISKAVIWGDMKDSLSITCKELAKDDAKTAH